jgi:hypothetical protein
MAALTAAIEINSQGSPPILVQKKSSGTLTFHRGSLLHTTAGRLLKAPAATDIFAGVAWESKATVANDLVFVAISGRFFFACAAFADADEGKVFAMPAAALTDNPADLAVSTTGSAGAVGTLDQVSSTGVNGVIDISRRAPAENL